MLDEVPESGEKELRHHHSATDELADGGREKGLGNKGVLSGFVFDDGPAHLSGGQVVGEAGGDECPGADADIDVEIVEVDAVEGLVEGPNRTDFVDRSFGAAAGEGETHS